MKKDTRQGEVVTVSVDSHTSKTCWQGSTEGSREEGKTPRLGPDSGLPPTYWATLGLWLHAGAPLYVFKCVFVCVCVVRGRQCFRGK